MVPQHPFHCQMVLDCARHWAGTVQRDLPSRLTGCLVGLSLLL